MEHRDDLQRETVPPGTGMLAPGDDNICLFSSLSEGDHDLFSYQFIYETCPERFAGNRSYSCYVCHLVTGGTAVLHCGGDSFLLQEGDLFFLFPMETFSLENCLDFRYLYISFLGKQVPGLLQSAGISEHCRVFHDYFKVTNIWFHGLSYCNAENLSELTKGLLLYTFALFHSGTAKQQTDGNDSGIIRQIQKCVDMSYANENLSLQYLCRQFQYNTKYISRRFREVMGINFQDYLQACRIRHACVLLTDTRMSIQEVAFSVGYRDALYFSKVFRKVMQATPTDYRMAERTKT